MPRLSSSTIALAVFWVTYVVAGAFLLYAALPPVNLELAVILGGAQGVFVALALVALHRKQAARSDRGHA